MPMEELDELRQAIEAGDYDQALAILDELDAMSRDDKITKVMSYMRVLLVHLIKQIAEQRSTRSWEESIAESLDRIIMLNKCRGTGSVSCNSVFILHLCCFLNQEDLMEREAM